MKAVLTVHVGGRDSEARRLPDEDIVVGRGMGWGFRRDDTWCSRMLLDLEPTERGWVAYNHQDGLAVQGPQVVEARYNKGAFVLLGRGSWVLSWDTRFRLVLEVLPTLTAELAALPLATATLELDALMSTDPTTLGLSRTDKHRLAVLFRHLLERRPAPANLARAAAEHLDMTEPVVRAYANAVRRRVSQIGHVDLPTVDALGDYLVHVRGIVTRADLAEP